MDRLTPGNPYAPTKALCWPDRIDALRAGRHPVPVHLYLVPTDRCNLACPTCLYHDRDRGKTAPELSRDVLLGALSNAATMGVRAVTVSGGGEPTVHPQMAEALDFARTAGMKTALVTNGILLDRMVDAAVSGSWLRFSLDAASPAMYAKVRPPAGGDGGRAFAQVVRNIFLARTRRDSLRTDCEIGVNFIVCRENWREMHAAARIARDCGADSIRFGGMFAPPDYWSGWGAQPAALEADSVRDFDVPGGFRVYPRFREMLAGEHVRRPDRPECWYQRVAPVLGADGNLYRCCATIYTAAGLLGSIVPDGLAALWSAEGTAARLASHDARTCAGCRYEPQNIALRAAIDASATPPAPAGVRHPEFV